MKIVLCTLMAAALAVQPLMLEAAEAPASQAPATPKVVGTSEAIGSGVDMETVELTLLIGGTVAAVLVGASHGGSHHKDCHCHGGGGGTTGTTP